MDLNEEHGNLNLNLELPAVHLYSPLAVRELFTIFHETFAESYSFSGETHNFWELSYIIDGHANIVVGDKIYDCSAGSLILVSPNLFHRIWITDKHQCEFLTITFDGMKLEKYLSAGKYTASEAEDHLAKSIVQELPLLLNYDASSISLPPLSSANNISYMMIKNMLELLCLSLSRREKEEKELPLQTESARCFAKALSYLQEHIEENLNIEQISAGIYESASKLKYIFRLYTGSGIMQHFHRMRIEHIIRLLREGYKVNEIATRMNFSSPYYLSYFFKRETDTTIRQYQQQNAKANQR